MKNNEREIQELADTIRRGNIRIMGILEGEEKEQGLERGIRQIVEENSPNLKNELELGIQEFPLFLFSSLFSYLPSFFLPLFLFPTFSNAHYSYVSSPDGIS